MGKQSKRTYKPLNASHSMMNTTASPMLDASRASRLADHLRNRRSPGLSGCSPNLRPEVFGPCLGNSSQEPLTMRSEQSSTWVQRARLLNLKLSLPDESIACLPNIFGGASVEELKQCIEKEHGILATHQTLSFSGKPLEGHASLVGSGVTDGALIMVRFRSTAGSMSVKSQPGYPALVSKNQAHHSKNEAGHQSKNHAVKTQMSQNKFGHHCNDQEQNPVETPSGNIVALEQQGLSQKVFSNEQTCSFVETPPNDTVAFVRQELLQEVFSHIDKDRDGFLNCQETCVLANLTGFDGDETEWAEEYRSLCAEHGADATLGVTCDLFMQLINDASDNGIYCSDDELRDMMQKLEI